jgi:hypothetical protein
MTTSANIWTLCPVLALSPITDSFLLRPEQQKGSKQVNKVLASAETASSDGQLNLSIDSVLVGSKEIETDSVPRGRARNPSIARIVPT